MKRLNIRTSQDNEAFISEVTKALMDADFLAELAKIEGSDRANMGQEVFLALYGAIRGESNIRVTTEGEMLDVVRTAIQFGMYFALFPDRAVYLYNKMVDKFGVTEVRVRINPNMN